MCLDDAHEAVSPPPAPEDLAMRERLERAVRSLAEHRGELGPAPLMPSDRPVVLRWVPPGAAEILHAVAVRAGLAAEVLLALRPSLPIPPAPEAEWRAGWSALLSALRQVDLELARQLGPTLLPPGTLARGAERLAETRKTPDPGADLSADLESLSERLRPHIGCFTLPRGWLRANPGFACRLAQDICIAEMAPLDPATDLCTGYSLLFAPQPQGFWQHPPRYHVSLGPANGRLSVRQCDGPSA